jgi:hypothetical protein
MKYAKSIAEIAPPAAFPTKNVPRHAERAPLGKIHGTETPSLRRQKIRQSRRTERDAATANSKSQRPAFRKNYAEFSAG